MQLILIQQLILLALTAFCSGLAMYFTLRGAKSAALIKDSSLEVSKLRVKMDMLEVDFLEKFDHFARKTASRYKMQKTRAQDEESEDSNTPNVLIPV